MKLRITPGAKLNAQELERKGRSDGLALICLTSPEGDRIVVEVMDDVGKAKILAADLGGEVRIGHVRHFGAGAPYAETI